MSRYLLLFITCGTLVLSLVACAAPDAAGMGETSSPPDRTRYSGRVIGVEGRVVLVGDRDLSFPITGQVAEVFVSAGDSVQAGDVLARLDTTILDAEVATAQAELAAAEASLTRIQAGLEPLQTTEAEYQVAATSVEHARASVVLAEARRAQATLISPVDGTVIAVSPRTYEFVDAGQPLVHIADSSHLDVETVGLLEADFTRIPTGAVATVTFDALDGIGVTGVVTGVAPATTAAGDVIFTARIALDEIPAGLCWGMTAYIEIPLD